MPLIFLTNEDKEELEKKIAQMGGSGNGGDANGLTDTEKSLVLTLFRTAAYTSNDMGAVLAQLENLWSGSGEVEPDEPDIPDVPDEPDEPIIPDDPEITLTSISATYSGGDVAVGTALTDLTGIVVTATYSDGSTANVTGYTLSGAIAEGANTVTVTYNGMTTTFTVTGVAESTGGEPIDAYTAYNWTDGLYLSWNASSKTVNETTNNAYTSSDYISLDGVAKIEAAEISGKNLAKYDAFFYDGTKKALSTSGAYVRKDNATYPSPVDVTIPDGASFVRFTGKISVLTSDGTKEPILKYYIYK